VILCLLGYILEAMKHKKKILGLCFALLMMACSLGIVHAQHWKLTQNTAISFVIDGPLGVDVSGTLMLKDYAIQFNQENLPFSSIYASADVQSINTGIEKRDNHLRGEDYFAVVKYPEIVIRSVAFERLLDGNYVMRAKLTMKSSTREIRIPFTFTHSGYEGKFVGAFEVNRLDYGVGEKSIMMGNTVKVRLEIPVVVADK
jgi:polyisoprenoid-binding protein YceI